MIRFVEIYKRHGRHELLSDIALTLNPGHFILITGANGSGKTSLLRIMAGLDRPDKAGVELMGQMRSWRRSRKALRQRVVYLHQRPYLFSGTVLSNLRFALSVNRIGCRPRQEKLERTISTFSLEHLVSREARRLSGGEQQRVALARAYLTEPEVLLLDEPTANMDIASRTQFVEMLRHAGTPNQSIVLVSHDLTGMDLGCDAHYDLDHGKLRQVVNQQLPGENPIHLKLVK